MAKAGMKWAPDLTRKDKGRNYTWELWANKLHCHTCHDNHYMGGAHVECNIVRLGGL